MRASAGTVGDISYSIIETMNKVEATITTPLGEQNKRHINWNSAVRWTNKIIKRELGYEVERDQE